MGTDPRLDALVAPLRADVVSGASVVARMGADVLKRAALRVQAGSLEEYRWSLGEVSGKILDAQPSMAPLVCLVRDVLGAVETATDVESGRHAAARTADVFRNGLDARTASVAERAAHLIAPKAKIVTVSSSATVRAVLLAGTDPRSHEVTCLESRPLQEGRLLAESLAREGIPVKVAVDAAASAVVEHADCVLLGADSVGDAGFVNKIGTVALVDAAKRWQVPVLVVADETKVLPVGFPQHVADDRPGEEVWHTPPRVRVWNRYFEIAPIELVTSLVTENAVMTPEQIAKSRAKLQLPDGLRHWAEARARRASEV